METNYYNRSNNFSAPIRREPKPYVPKTLHKEEEYTKKEAAVHTEDSPEKKENTRLLKKFKSDDLLLLGLIFLFLSDSNDDTLMLLALGYLFLCSHTKS